MLTEAQLLKRAKLASTAAKAARDPENPALAAEVDALRAEYRYVSAAAYIDQLVATAPALSAEQRDKLAVLLRGAAA